MHPPPSVVGFSFCKIQMKLWTTSQQHTSGIRSDFPSNHNNDTKGLFTMMIPEWVSFQNEDLTAFTWQNRPAQPKAFSRAQFSRQIKYACVTHPRLHGLRFHLGTEFVFSLHDTRMKCHTRTRISFRLKTGVNSLRGRNFVSVSRQQIQRNIRGWNELVLEWKPFQNHVNGPWGMPTTTLDSTTDFTGFLFSFSFYPRILQLYG